MQNPKFLSTGQIVARILAVILVAEFLIMLLIGSMDFDSDQLVIVAVIDTLFLAVFATPALYKITIICSNQDLLTILSDVE